MVPPGRCHRDGTNPSIVSFRTGWRLGAVSGCQVVAKIAAGEPADAGRPHFRSQPPSKRSKRHPSKTCTYEIIRAPELHTCAKWNTLDNPGSDKSVHYQVTNTQKTHTHMQTYTQVHTWLHMHTYTCIYHMYIYIIFKIHGHTSLHWHEHTHLLHKSQLLSMTNHDKSHGIKVYKSDLIAWSDVAKNGKQQYYAILLDIHNMQSHHIASNYNTVTYIKMIKHEEIQDNTSIQSASQPASQNHT